MLTAAEEQALRDHHNQAQQLLCEFAPLWTRSGVDYRLIPAHLYQQLRQTILANAKNSLFMPFFGRQMRVLQWQLFAPTDTNHQRLRRWTHLTSTPLDQAQERTRLRAHRINGQGTHQPGDELFAGILTAHRNRFGVISDALLLEQGPAVLQYYRYFVPLRYCYRPKRHKPNAQHGWRIQPIRQRVKRSGTSLRAQQQRLSASSTRCCWRNDGNSGHGTPHTRPHLPTTLVD